MFSVVVTGGVAGEAPKEKGDFAGAAGGAAAAGAPKENPPVPPDDVEGNSGFGAAILAVVLVTGGGCPNVKGLLGADSEWALPGWLPPKGDGVGAGAPKSDGFAGSLLLKSVVCAGSLAVSTLGAPNENGAGDAAGTAAGVLAGGTPKLKGLGEGAGGSAGFAGAPKEKGVLAGAGVGAGTTGAVLGTSVVVGGLVKNELAGCVVVVSLGAVEDPKNEGTEELDDEIDELLPNEKGLDALPVPNREGAASLDASSFGASFCWLLPPNKDDPPALPNENGVVAAEGEA